MIDEVHMLSIYVYSVIDILNEPSYSLVTFFAIQYEHMLTLEVTRMTDLTTLENH